MLEGEGRSRHCRILCRQSPPWRGSWCLERRRPPWTAPWGRRTGHGCPRTPGQYIKGVRFTLCVWSLQWFFFSNNKTTKYLKLHTWCKIFIQKKWPWEITKYHRLKNINWMSKKTYTIKQHQEEQTCFTNPNIIISLLKFTLVIFITW